jgi:hypothetical protein
VRVVALGASNLTRGFRTVVATSRCLWGPEVEVFAALGHGRSYGMGSSVLGRRLPGILQCGIWDALAARGEAPCRALVTDVGNDIAYGASVPQILEWVDACIGRLQAFTPDIVLTDLPLARMRRLSRPGYLFFRSLLVPSCRLSLPALIEAAEATVEGLARLAARRGVRWHPLRPEWYGLDPIHIRPRLWSTAWRDILCGSEPLPRGVGASALESLRLYRLLPERSWLFGRERVRPQGGLRLPRGGRVWLY